MQQLRTAQRPRRFSHHRCRSPWAAQRANNPPSPGVPLCERRCGAGAAAGLTRPHQGPRFAAHHHAACSPMRAGERWRCALTRCARRAARASCALPPLPLPRPRAPCRSAARQPQQPPHPALRPRPPRDPAAFPTIAAAYRGLPSAPIILPARVCHFASGAAAREPPPGSPGRTMDHVLRRTTPPSARPRELVGAGAAR